MASPMLDLAEAVIQSYSQTKFAESIQLLGTVFPEPLLLGALDIIDRQDVCVLDTAWGHVQCDVSGSRGTSFVTLNLANTPVPHFCTCTSFTRAVLIEKTHLMCKHVLAAKLTLRMSPGSKRQIGLEELAALTKLRYE